MKRPTHVENEDPVLTRITDLLIQQGKSQRELTENLGLNKGQYSAWKSGQTTSYQKYIGEIASFLEVSPTYLLNGDEELTKDENELLRIYRTLDEPKRKRLLQTAAGM